jgi:hypothetical protein
MIANGLERVGLVDNVRCSESDEFTDGAIAEWARIAVNKRLCMAISCHSNGYPVRTLYTCCVVFSVDIAIVLKCCGQRKIKGYAFISVTT